MRERSRRYDVVRVQRAHGALSLRYGLICGCVGGEGGCAKIVVAPWGGGNVATLAVNEFIVARAWRSCWLCWVASGTGRWQLCEVGACCK